MQQDIVGRDIHRYHILSQLGEGGMATIYKAVDTRLDREVAIKFLRTERLDSDKAKKRFELEAKALARLKHPHIVQVLDFGEFEGSPYLVMDYQEGGSLNDRLGKPVAWREALKLLLPVAEALASAHQNKILHRDVKPSNILISRDGRPMLSDFGVAKILEMDETLDLTGTSVGVGTPYYMAPEQGLSKTFDQRVDVYSLGVVLYELVTGRKPYLAETPMAVVFKHASDPLPRPRDFVKDLPREVERVIIKALMKEPTERYQTMDEFARVLQELSSKTESKLKRKEKKVDREKAHQLGWWLWVGMGTALVLISAYFIMAQINDGSQTGIKGTQISEGTVLNNPSQTISINPSLTQHSDPALTDVPKPLDFEACMVADINGINDSYWNAAIWHGVQESAAALDISVDYLESQWELDYETNIQTFLNDGCDVIILSGLSMADAALESAKNNPDAIIVIPDADWIAAENIVGIGFNISDASYLAGYLSAGMTKTGRVGTYGGIDVPAVTAFMDGFVQGVEKYNQVHGSEVHVLGWDLPTGEGLFVGNFTSLEDGRTMGQTLLDEGADIIMPVAGPVGIGTLQLLEERGNGYFIGIDIDWSAQYSYVNLADHILASAVKGIDMFAFDQIQTVYEGNFVGGNISGTLNNGYIDLVYGSDLEDSIPSELKIEIEDLREALINGSVDNWSQTKPEGTVDDPEVEQIQAGSSKTSPVDGMVMMAIPPGEFTMGSANGDPDESPVHKVYLDGFWMDQHEVTFEQFESFTQEADYEADLCGAEGYPAACVSWDDAETYCEWAGRRLPTEAEWEKAARGGLGGKRYPWGDQEPSCQAEDQNGAHYIKCGNIMASFTGEDASSGPVKTFAPNGYGLYDMAGNIYEWVADWYDAYPEGDPKASDIFGQKYRVLRGGSWDYYEYYLRVASRGWSIPYHSVDNIGFRCAMSVGND